MHTSASSQIIWHEQKLERIRDAAERLQRAYDFLQLCRHNAELAKVCGALKDAHEGFEKTALELMAIIV